MRSKLHSVISAASASFAFAFATSLAGVASAHAVLASPPPRDTTAHKDPNPNTNPTACGVARTAKYMDITAGSTFTVKWNETVGHRGCYQIAFSMAGDTNFQVLKQIDDPAGKTAGEISTTVVMPNVTCTGCTLQLMQLMNDAAGGTPCPANANPALATSGTYHSCADIHLIAAPSTDGADAGVLTGEPAHPQAGG